MWDGFNNRKFPRVNLNVALDVRVEGETEHINTTTENIGIGGMCILIDKKLEKFQELQLSFSLEESGKTIQCKGKIVWIIEKRTLHEKTVRYDVGIEFVGLAADDSGSIKEFIHKQSSTVIS